MPLPPYTFTSSQIGLMALPGFIGTSLGVILTGLLSDRSILYLSRRNRGIYEPEFRLYLIPLFAPFVPAGAILYACALERGWSWVAVGGGYLMCNFGGAPVSAVALTYVTDSYSEVCHVVLKSLLARCISSFGSGIGVEDVEVAIVPY